MERGVMTNRRGAERRRHPRVPLGLPVRVQVAGAVGAVTLELIDVSSGGGAFRAPATRVRIGDPTAFGFVVAGGAVCVAKGRVIRAHRDGFAVALDRMNQPFRTFLADISGPTANAA